MVHEVSEHKERSLWPIIGQCVLGSLYGGFAFYAMGLITGLWSFDVNADDGTGSYLLYGVMLIFITVGAVFLAVQHPWSGLAACAAITIGLAVSFALSRPDQIPSDTLFLGFGELFEIGPFPLQFALLATLAGVSLSRMRKTS